MKAEITVIHGSGEIVAMLEDLLLRARQGEIEAIAASVVAEGTVYSRIAYIEDTGFTWSRLTAAVVHTQHSLLTDGI